MRNIDLISFEQLSDSLVSIDVKFVIPWRDQNITCYITLIATLTEYVKDGKCKKKIQYTSDFQMGSRLAMEGRLNAVMQSFNSIFSDYLE